MRAALAALPGVRHVDVDFDSKQAVVTVEPDGYDKGKFIAALERAGFGGSVKAVKPAHPIPADGSEPTSSPPVPGLIGEEPAVEPNQTNYSSASFAEHVQVSAHLDRDVLRPGDAFRIAVVFDIDDGWHIYGNPLGPGIGKETVISADVPKGFELEPARYVPAHRAEQNFGEAGKTWVWEHTGRTAHFLSGRVSDSTEPGAYQLTVEASAQVCTEVACLPGQATMQLLVTVVEADAQSHPANSELFKSFDPSRAP